LSSEPRAIRRIVGAFLCAALTACASAPTGPRAIATDTLKARPAYDLDWITSYETALATVCHIMERDLRLPRLQVTVRFYPDRETFEAALVGVGYNPQFARDTAEIMTAIGGYRGVLINERKLGSRPWPQRIATLAHELTHSLQYEVGGGQRGASDQWLREGFGEWVAARVLERLGLTTLNDAVMRGVLTLQSRRRPRDAAAADAGGLPPLGAMVTFPQWVALGQNGQGAMLYDQAFVAVDVLIRRHGVDAVLAYFTRFAATQDRVANFRAAFGEDLETFEGAFRDSVWKKKR
jgi:hypothetical protein